MWEAQESWGFYHMQINLVSSFFYKKNLQQKLRQTFVMIYNKLNISVKLIMSPTITPSYGHTFYCYISKLVTAQITRKTIIFLLISLKTQHTKKFHSKVLDTKEISFLYNETLGITVKVICVPHKVGQRLYWTKTELQYVHNPYCTSPATNFIKFILQFKRGFPYLLKRTPYKQHNQQFMCNENSSHLL